MLTDCLSVAKGFLEASVVLEEKSFLVCGRKGVDPIQAEARRLRVKKEADMLRGAAAVLFALGEGESLDSIYNTMCESVDYFLEGKQEMPRKE